jgi:phosphatidylglycerophosphatase A
VRAAGSNQSLAARVNTFLQKAVLFSVTGAGSGYFPRLPGTVGTLVAIPFSLALNRIAVSNLPLALVIVVASIFCAIWLSTQAASVLKQKDPQCIVIDEIVGFLVANFLAPPRWTALLLSFLLFRFFDIAKMFPINRLEQLPGGAGIVLDDVVAGVYALITLRLLLTIGWA